VSAKKASPLLPKDLIMLHNIGQKYIAQTSDKLFWGFHVISKTIQEKVAAYLKENKHRSALLHKDPRTCCGTQAQSVMGLFMNYDAKKTSRLQNQEKKAVNMSLEFTTVHEKSYKELSTSVAVALPEMKGKDLVSNFVRLCVVEIKFLHGCRLVACLGHR
jgi:hypothetical protein